MSAEVLRRAAFGDLPSYWPLPGADGPGQSWLRAVAAGGQGHYAAAHAELEPLLGVAGPLGSLAHSTRASLLRQLGAHALARGLDGRAMLLAGTDRQARADALTGLAADALGLGRFAASATLLAQASDAVTDDVPRLAIRLAWVGAELAMATGDGTTALRRAERGVELAADFASVRHRVKSAVVLAAARCAAGDLDGAREGADAALTDTETHGLVPLRWALASLLAGIGSSRPPEQIAEIRDTAAALVTSRGGHWHP